MNITQMDLFAQRPIAVPRMPDTASRGTKRKTCPIVHGGLPHGPTADLRIVVHDGIKNLTYYVS